MKCNIGPASTHELGGAVRAHGRPGVSQQANGRWNSFPNGIVHDGKGGTETLKLAEQPVTARWIRVVMTQSSNQPGPHGTGDLRHRAGYAIYQVYAGMLLDDGTFVDLVRHSPDATQTPTYCSSTDPYHSATDLNKEGDQTGLDLSSPAVLPTICRR